MTLGRTSSGAIKIKTDEEGGGLRAVNCACCNPCPSYPIDLSWYPEITGDPYSEFLRGGTITISAQITENYLGVCSYSATESFEMPASTCGNGFEWQVKAETPCTNADGGIGQPPFDFSSFSARIVTLTTTESGTRLLVKADGLCPASDENGYGDCYSVGAWVPHYDQGSYYYYSPEQICGSVDIVFNSESAFTASVPLIGLYSATMSMSVEFTPAP